MFELLTTLYNLINHHVRVRLFTKFEEAKLTFDGVTHINISMVIPYKDNVEEIVILNSVTLIRTYAFSGCRNLTSITIPDSVTKIGEGAFRGCTNLTSIAIPNGVKEISTAVFYNCKSLTSITIPDSVTKIGEGAFIGCRNLSSITIPNSVTKIGEGAFSDCDNLDQIVIPDSLNNQDTNYWASRGIDLNKTQLVTHNQVLSEWAEEYNLEGHYSTDELSTLYQLQKDNDYQPSWSELGRKSRHIIIRDLLNILPKDKINAALPQTLIGQHGSREGQLLHTLSLLSQAPIENLNQENENNEYNTLSLGESLGNTLTLADTAKLLLLSVEKPKKAKNTTSSSTDEVSIPPLARRPLDSIKHPTQNPHRR